MSSLKERTIVITGAAMGLGLAVAKEAASQGANLALIDFNAAALQEAKASLHALYPEVDLIAIHADVSDEAAVKMYVEQTVKAFGRIDGFYNNAGIEGSQTSLIEYDVDLFKKVIDINLLGVHYGLRHIIPVMKEQGYGRVVNVASVAGIQGLPNLAAYVATKHAVAGLTKVAALEYAKNGVITNAIAPGYIQTPMVAAVFSHINPEDPSVPEKASAEQNPVKRIGLPDEVAKVVAFLLSEDSSYLNGQVIAIDGGLSNAYGPV